MLPGNRKIKIIHCGKAGRLVSVISSYYQALKLRARVYHLHDPELLILGWCFRMFTSAAIIYDAHRPTYHYFLWKFGARNFITRFKAAVLKLVEIIGVIFIDGLIVAAPQSLKNIGRFSPQKVLINNYPRLPVKTVTGSNGHNLLFRGSLCNREEMNLLLEVFFQLKLQYANVSLLIAGVVEDDLIPLFEKQVVEMSLENIVRVDQNTDWEQWFGSGSVGLSITTDNDYYQRSQQPEVLEYMARGIPVVCGRTPFTEEVVADNDTGLIYRKAAPLEISENVIILWSDKNQRREMGARGMTVVSMQYNWSIMAGRLCNFYRRISRS